MEERNWGTGIIGESEELVQKLWGKKRGCDQGNDSGWWGEQIVSLWATRWDRTWRMSLERKTFYPTPLPPQSLSFLNVFRNCSCLQRANRKNSLWIISFFAGLLWLFSSDSYKYVVCLQSIVFRLKYSSSPESVFDSTFTG